MENLKTLVYDGSFNGYLSAVFVAYESRITIEGFKKQGQFNEELFNNTQYVITNVTRALRVWNAIQEKGQNHLRNIYFAFLSGEQGIDMLLFRYLQLLFKSSESYTEDKGLLVSRNIIHTADMVSREKQRIEAFLRFEMSRDGILYADCQPKFDILPLISKHYKNRFTDQPWIVYDNLRNYGLFGESSTVQMISLNLSEGASFKFDDSELFEGERSLSLKPAGINLRKHLIPKPSAADLMRKAWDVNPRKMAV